MSCKNVCKICDNLVVSTAVAFTTPNLIITIPENNYYNGSKYCIVVAQDIPTTTTITAPVVIQIGDGTVLYPLNKTNCVQATACGIKARTRYSTVVVTNSTGGSFQLLGSICCYPNNDLQYIDGNAPTDEGGVVSA